MKKITSVLFSLFMVIGAFAQHPNYKVFPFKTGTIEYNLVGNTKGTHTKYIDDYGYKQADYTETATKVFGFTTKEKTATILIGPKVYSIDYKTNSATTGENPVYSLYANGDGANYDELGQQAMKSLGYKNSGNSETILGKSCEVWEGSLGKIWIWKSLPLKTQTNVLGITITETATKIETGSGVPADKFEIPKGMKTEEVEIPEGMEGLLKAGSSQISDEDKKAMQDVANMSYADFKKMILKEEPNMSEEEIKAAYNMTKQMSKFLK